MSTEDTAVSTLVGHPATVWLIRAGQRLRQWDTRHRWALDTAGVLVIFLLFGAPDLWPDQGRPDAPISFTQGSVPQMLLFQAGLLIPLWWRRRAPMMVFYVVVAVFLLQWSAGILLRADVALLVALYNLVLHGRLRRLAWAAPGLIAVLSMVMVRLSSLFSAWDVLFFVASFGTAAIALGFAVRIRRAQLAVLRDRAVQLEIERDQRSKLAAAEERTRVAREMHDIVGHSMSVIITLADGGKYAANTEPERSKEALQLIGETGRRSLAELRRILGVLRQETDQPNLSPQPVIADLDQLCEQIRAAGPQVEYHSTGELNVLDPGVQLAAYRIVQEALTNSLKHAGPHTQIHLALRNDGTRLHILVRDTGPPGGNRSAAEEGHGLIGMRERAALYAGSVSAGPGPGGGWTVEAILDLSSLADTGGDLP